MLLGATRRALPAGEHRNTPDRPARVPAPWRSVSGLSRWIAEAVIGHGRAVGSNSITSDTRPHPDMASLSPLAPPFRVVRENRPLVEPAPMRRADMAAATATLPQPAASSGRVLIRPAPIGASSYHRRGHDLGQVWCDDALVSRKPAVRGRRHASRQHLLRGTRAGAQAHRRT